jgi:hypothetical protein
MKIVFEGTLPEIVGEVLMFVQDANSMVTHVPEKEDVDEDHGTNGELNGGANANPAAKKHDKPKRNGESKAGRKGRVTVGGDSTEDEPRTGGEPDNDGVDVQDSKRNRSKKDAGSVDPVSYSASDAGKAASSAAALVGPAPVRKIIAVLAGGSEELKNLPEDKRGEFIDACADFHEAKASA